MKTQNGEPQRNRWSSSIVTLVAFGLLVVGWNVGSAGAGLVTLTDLNSRVEIDPHSSDGMYEWKVDGVNHLKEQWFWYRIGEDLDFDYESPIDTLDTFFSPVVVTTGFGSRGVQMTYSANDFDLEITYLLTGGTAGSGTSDIAETIRIINTSGDDLPFHFFQYSDFDLNGTPDDDTAKLTNENTITQSDPLGVMSETVVTPKGNHWQIDLAPNVRDFLDDLDLNDLNDSTSPLGPDDLEWAWQWDKNIAANGTFIISKDKHISTHPVSVPEPTGLLLMGLGLGTVGFWRLGKGWLRRRQHGV